MGYSVLKIGSQWEQLSLEIRMWSFKYR